ncbi:hypothetical protein VTL71DRAFT_7295 [Oculimacula yallundae]|uniref:Uncharacterized protein n=1 Tax=Oculimacula yallundae TaxID=86028 RepID=A0ABR4BX09_9HELO
MDGSTMDEGCIACEIACMMATERVSNLLACSRRKREELVVGCLVYYWISLRHMHKRSLKSHWDGVDVCK